MARYIPVTAALTVVCRRFWDPKQLAEETPEYLVGLDVTGVNEYGYQRQEYSALRGSDLMTIFRKIAYEIQRQQVGQINAPHRWRFDDATTDGPPQVPQFGRYGDGKFF